VPIYTEIKDIEKSLAGKYIAVKKIIADEKYHFLGRVTKAVVNFIETDCLTHCYEYHITVMEDDSIGSCIKYSRNKRNR